jgi:hypothetical protein
MFPNYLLLTVDMPASKATQDDSASSPSSSTDLPQLASPKQMLGRKGHPNLGENLVCMLLMGLECVHLL